MFRITKYRIREEKGNKHYVEKRDLDFILPIPFPLFVWRSLKEDGSMYYGSINHEPIVFSTGVEAALWLKKTLEDKKKYPIYYPINY